MGIIYGTRRAIYAPFFFVNSNTKSPPKNAPIKTIIRDIVSTLNESIINEDIATVGVVNIANIRAYRRRLFIFEASISVYPASLNMAFAMFSGLSGISSIWFFMGRPRGLFFFSGLVSISPSYAIRSL